MSDGGIVKTAAVASEGGHWYDYLSKTQVTEVVGSKGKPVTPDLRHARKLGLCRGVTSIIKLAHKHQLVEYQVKQGIMCALTLTRKSGETDTEFVARVLEDSRRQAIEDANRGTEIHCAIERCMRGERWDDALDPWVDGFRQVLDGAFGAQSWRAEQVAVSELGYGTKCDLHCDGIVLDIKTKSGSVLDQQLYREHYEQLAATRLALEPHNSGSRDWRCAIAFVSRDTDLDGGKIAETGKPAQVCIAMAGREELEKGWRRFAALLRYSFEVDGYRPPWALETTR